MHEVSPFRLYTISEVKAILNVGDRVVKRLIRQGHIECVPREGTQWRLIKGRSIIDWMEQKNTMKPARSDLNRRFRERLEGR